LFLENAVDYVSNINEYTKIAEAFSFNDIKKGISYKSFETHWKEEKVYLNTLAFTTFNKSGLGDIKEKKERRLIKAADTFNYVAFQKLKEEKTKAIVKWQSHFNRFPCLMSVTLNNFRNDIEKLIDLITNGSICRDTWKKRFEINKIPFNKTYVKEDEFDLEEASEEDHGRFYEKKEYESRKINLSQLNMLKKNMMKKNIVKYTDTFSGIDADLDYLHNIDFSSKSAKKSGISNKFY